MNPSIQQRIKEAAEIESNRFSQHTGTSVLVNTYFKTGADFVLNTILPEEIEKAIHWIIDSKYQYEAAHRWIDSSLEGSSPLYTTSQLIELFKNRDNG